MTTSKEILRAERIAALVEAARIERAQTIRRMLLRLLGRARCDRADVTWPAQARPAGSECR